MSKKPTILSIAGFDSSCGAGVVADVNTARVLGAHGVAVTNLRNCSKHNWD